MKSITYKIDNQNYKLNDLNIVVELLISITKSINIRGFKIKKYNIFNLLWFSYY